jgi:hypothetical protein
VGRCRPIIWLFHGPLLPLAPIILQRPGRRKTLAEKKIVAGLDRADFLLPLNQDYLDALPGQTVLLEERVQICLPFLALMMHDDSFRLNFDQVQPASPDHEPDDALVIRWRQS